MRKLTPLITNIMHEEQMAYEYKKEHGVFPTYPVSDQKEIIYPEDMTDEDERMLFLRFEIVKNKAPNTPSNLWKNFKPNYLGNGGGRQEDFINLIGDPEYKR